METSLTFSRSNALNNIPNKKLLSAINDINNSSDTNEIKSLKITAINRYAESNIPVEYWNLSMKKFFGDPQLLEHFNNYVLDLKKSYITGNSFCLAGAHGLGKTMTAACILKQASIKGYSCLYTTLSDIVSILTTADSEDKYKARKELIMVDFLVVDELDPRFMATDSASDLYARTLEGVFRTRAQNKLPIIMCTNSPNVLESFNGQLKQSISSLFKGYIKINYVFGEDARGK
jgi:DNA replication protein DnaC